MIKLDTAVSMFGGKELYADKFFTDCEKSGIKYVELSPTYPMLENYDYAGIAKAAEKHGIGLWSFHFPFYPADVIDPSSPDSGIQKSTAEIFNDCIAKASDVGIKHFVVHPSSEPIADEERAERIKCTKEFLGGIANKNKNSVICVENLPRTCIGNCSEEILDILSADESLRACFDTNHLLSEPTLDFIEKVGDRIETLHVSDYDYMNERHWLPGEGCIDWQALIKALLCKGYHGPWLYEVIFELPKTILRERELYCEDIARNAKELFSGKPLTVISKPKPDLGMWE